MHDSVSLEYLDTGTCTLSYPVRLLLKLVLKIRAEHRLFRGALRLVWPIFSVLNQWEAGPVSQLKKIPNNGNNNDNKKFIKKWHVLPRL